MNCFCRRCSSLFRRLTGVLAVVIVCTLNTAVGSAVDHALKDFSVIVLPDTQYYAKRYPETFDKQTRWIVAYKDQLNIKFVIHLGDITHDNTREQWNVADRAYKKFDEADIPYGVVPGNHDTLKKGMGGIRDTTDYNKYFGPHRFRNKRWYGGHMGSTNENNFAFFKAGDLKFMVVGLEFAPSGKALSWANHLIDQYKDRRVIIFTHCYQAKTMAGELGDGAHQRNCATRYNLEGSGGDEVWERLVSRHKNIFMVLSGHISDVEYKIRKGLAGNHVHEILTDYQSERSGGDEKNKKSGNGWLRILRFAPHNNKIYVSPHSVDGETRYYLTSRYNKNPRHSDHTYSFVYDMVSP